MSSLTRVALTAALFVAGFASAWVLRSWLEERAMLEAEQNAETNDQVRTPSVPSRGDAPPAAPAPLRCPAVSAGSEPQVSHPQTEVPEVDTEMIDGPGDLNTPWDRIQIKGEFDLIRNMGPEEKVLQRHLNDGVAGIFTGDLKTRCKDPWRPPPGFDLATLDFDLSLSLESLDDGIHVRDVEMESRDLSDPDLEHCVTETLRGRSLPPVDGLSPGKRYRVRIPCRWVFTAP